MGFIYKKGENYVQCKQKILQSDDLLCIHYELQLLYFHLLIFADEETGEIRLAQFIQDDLPIDFQDADLSTLINKGLIYKEENKYFIKKGE